jgi:glutathione S-transferase
MVRNPGTVLSGAVTILVVLFYSYTMFRVGALRGKHGVKAPACVGPPEFERGYRVQMNTLEQMAIMLPLFWVATVYPLVLPLAVPAIGVVWIIGRIVYMQAYMANPDKRLAGMVIGLLCNVALLVLAVGGVVRAQTLRSFAVRRRGLRPQTWIWKQGLGRAYIGANGSRSRRYVKS